jgi:hypothetical protein
VIAVAIVASVIMWRSCSRSDAVAPVAHGKRNAEIEISPSTTAQRSPPTPTVVPHVDLDAEPLAPIVDQVIVEHNSVCEGEETLISVKAHTAGNKEDQFLHYMIGSELGASVALKMFPRDNKEGEPPPLVVRVFGRNNVTTEVPVPPIEVRSCKAERRVHVLSRILPNSDEIELTAKVIEVTSTTPLRPVEARWEFGDGQRTTTVGPLVTHDYGRRSQDSLYSQFVVTVEVVGTKGERVVGRTSLQLLNPAFEHLAYKHMVLLQTAMTPRFPEVVGDAVRQRVHVWHRYREAVRVKRVLRYAHAVDNAVDDPAPEVIEPSALFGATTIGPGGVDATVELAMGSPWFSYEYAIEGESMDGLPAAGTFSVMRPPPRPTKENSEPVIDPLLKAKILRARELLHQEFVTDEDIYRLQGEGAFDDLIKAAANHPEPMGTPPPLPPR